MTKAEFIKEFKRLQEYYGKEITDKDTLLRYYNAVKDKTPEQFKQQVNRLMQTEKFMPKVADFNKKKSNHEEREYSDEFLESQYDDLEAVINGR